MAYLCLEAKRRFFSPPQLLTKDPKHRLGCGGSGAREVQSHPFFQTINFRMLEAGLVQPPFKPDVSSVHLCSVAWGENQPYDGFTLHYLVFNILQPRNVTFQNVQLSLDIFKTFNLKKQFEPFQYFPYVHVLSLLHALLKKRHCFKILTMDADLSSLSFILRPDYIVQQSLDIRNCQQDSLNFRTFHDIHSTSLKISHL